MVITSVIRIRIIRVSACVRKIKEVNSAYATYKASVVEKESKEGGAVQLVILISHTTEIGN